ncbi:MAG: hypothetical protein ACI8PD_001790 [Nitrospinales bacterium]|jgi:hypothetical protein
MAIEMQESALLKQEKLLINKLLEDIIVNSKPLSLAENLEIERESEKIEFKKVVLKIKSPNSISNIKSTIKSALSTLRSNMSKMWLPVKKFQERRGFLLHLRRWFDREFLDF